MSDKLRELEKLLEDSLPVDFQNEVNLLDIQAVKSSFVTNNAVAVWLPSSFTGKNTFFLELTISTNLINGSEPKAALQEAVRRLKKELDNLEAVL